MSRVAKYFPRYDILVVDGDGEGGDAVAAGGWGVPFDWDGTRADLPDGYDSTLVRAAEGFEAGRPATALSFMAAAVAPGRKKRGLATMVLDELTNRAHRDGLTHIVAPLRPTWKHRYPNVSMDEYTAWVRQDGLHVDPWIRTHQRMGASVLGTASRSMVVEGTVAEWEEWTDMVFPVSGHYVVPGALSLVHIDRDQDTGVYVEENLWVQHA
jgi:GNAT superfamily N-acetyltransferase